VDDAVGDEVSLFTRTRFPLQCLSTLARSIAEKKIMKGVLVVHGVRRLPVLHVGENSEER
jgi:hypothetical protein